MAFMRSSSSKRIMSSVLLSASAGTSMGSPQINTPLEKGHASRKWSQLLMTRRGRQEKVLLLLLSEC